MKPNTHDSQTQDSQLASSAQEPPTTTEYLKRPRRKLPQRWKQLSRTRKIALGTMLFSGIIVVGVCIWLLGGTNNKPSGDPPTQKADNNYSNLLDQSLEVEQEKEENVQSKYQREIEIGPDKTTISLERINNSDSANELIMQGESLEYQLVVGGNHFYKFNSKNWPDIMPYGNDDQRIVLRKYDTNNASFHAVDLKGSTSLIVSEPDDAIYLTFHESTISRNKDKFLFTKVSVQYEACGGETPIKVPDFTGPIVELHSLNLTTKQDTLVVKDERKPFSGVTEDLPYGLKVFGYSADDTKLYAAKSGPPGCNGLSNAGVYEITIAPNGAVKQIPYDNDTPNSISYPNSISDDGRYLYYTNLSKETGQEVYRRYDLTSGSDEIVEKHQTTNKLQSALSRVVERIKFIIAE